MRTVRAYAEGDPCSRVRVEVGRSGPASSGRPCAFMTQGQDDDVQTAVLFKIRDGKVSRFDLCIPQLIGAERTGMFPV